MTFPVEGTINCWNIGGEKCENFNSLLSEVNSLRNYCQRHRRLPRKTNFNLDLRMSKGIRIFIELSSNIPNVKGYKVNFQN